MRISALLSLLLLTVSAVAQQSNDLIVPISGAPQILIPAAGDVAGANGTHFRSEISIINLRNVTQRVNVFWLPQGSSGELIGGKTIDLAPQSGFFSENFVGSFLQESGLGSIEIAGVTGTNAIDPDARLHAAARIWTPRPDGASGTMSQTFPAIVLTDDNIDVKGIFGLRRSSLIRLNVGISNPIDEARTFRVTTVISPSGGAPVTTQFEVNIAAESMQQVNVSGTTEGIAQFIIEDITPTQPDGPWHAWASSIDNLSGDAWSHMAVPGS